MTRRLAPLVLSLALAACGGDGGSDSAAPVAAPSPAPVASPSPTASPSPSASATPTGFAAQAAALYDTPPDPATCRAGTLRAGVKADFLAVLNAIRARHNLPAVTYSNAEDAQEQDSSLMMAVNRALSHDPPTGWTCYSSSGANGAGTSNLIGGWGGGLGFGSEEDALASWLNEGGSASLGHRRWILSPFLGKTSYGRVTYATAGGDRVSTASMRVFGFTGGVTVPGGIPAFVALPFGDYPARYFRPGDHLSFTAVPNTGSSFGNQNVSFARATITVTGPGGTLPVTDISSDNDGYGVPNNLQWRVTGLQVGTTYTVRIAGVTGSTQGEYSYSFKIV